MRLVRDTTWRRYRNIGAACSAVLLITIPLLLSGCGTSTAKAIPVQFWTPSVLVVALQSDDGGLPSSTPTSSPTIPSGVTNEINGLLKRQGLSVSPLVGSSASPILSGTGTVPALMVFGGTTGNLTQVAIASYQVRTTNHKSLAPDAGYTDPATAAKTINDAVAGLGSIAIGKSQVWIDGATPDLEAMAGGLEDVGGSPDGPPAQEQSSTANWNPTPAQISSNSGSGENIYVLDTAPDTLSNNQLCVEQPASGTETPKVIVNPSAGTSCDFLNLFDETFGLPADLVDAGYPYSGNSTSAGVPSDTSFELHGEFAAKIIQHIAPGANLHLIRVLDDFGAADLRSLLYGLDQVMNDTGENGSNTIVNLSLSLDPITQCLPSVVSNPDTTLTQTTTYGTTSSGEPITPVTQVNSTPAGTLSETYNLGHGATSNSASTKYPITNLYADLHCVQSLTNILSETALARLYVPIGLVVKQMIADNYKLVAAAGNDSNRGARQDYAADMPAAFCGVYAVAATVRPRRVRVLGAFERATAWPISRILPSSWVRTPPIRCAFRCRHLTNLTVLQRPLPIR